MDKYLLEILKESNTIIIPGLGALTITNSETGETMFMPYLQHDDGKLAAFVAEKDGLEEADAKIMVGRYVREIQATLSKGEPYAMFQLGTFVKAEDGDVQYTHWPNPVAAEKTPETPVVEDEMKIADEPIVAAEPEVETVEEPIEEEVASEPVVDAAPDVIEITEDEVEIKHAIEKAIKNTPEPDAEAIAEAIGTPEIPKEIIPEPSAEVPTPEFDAEEIEVKNAIEKALKNTPEPDVAAIVGAIKTPEIPKEVIPEVTLEPSPGIENIVDSGPVEEEIVATVPEIDAEEEEEGKEKPSAKFWIYLILIAVIIIGGGAYIGRNYNELKQHIPFLADEKPVVKSKPVLDEMDEMIKSGKNEKSTDRDRVENDGSDNLDEGNGTDKVNEDKTPVKPEPVVKPEPRPTPVVSSSGGHYHIIAGAFSSVENANNLAKEFKAKGLGSSVIKNGELNAVSMQSYATSAEAKANLSKMNAIQPGAWILYK